MNIQITLKCKDCSKRLSFDVPLQGKVVPVKTIRAAANKKNWHLGRACYCPSCLAALPHHCGTCAFFDGRSRSGAQKCKKDGKFTLPLDFCKQYLPAAEEHSARKYREDYR